ncbi:MAG: hypothetical protein FJ126_02710 [Deltaproteobacteria bacterium]|nr:hypothetical protein [Deltaproteobacteria bacterium]
MKTRKAVLVLVAMGLLMASFVGTASAATVTCSVDGTGVFNTSAATPVYYVFLTDTAATPVWNNKKCSLPAARGKEYLAVALTALANGKTVTVTCANTAAAVPAITSMIANK